MISVGGCYGVGARNRFSAPQLPVFVGQVGSVTDVLTAPPPITSYFTAPKVNPRTSCFCVSHPMTMIGATVSELVKASAVGDNLGWTFGQMGELVRISIQAGNCRW